MVFTFYFTFLCHVCPNYPHRGLTTATAPSGHQMATAVSRTVYYCWTLYMMMSWHGNTFHITGPSRLCEGNPLAGQFSKQRTSNAELWWFLWYKPKNCNTNSQVTGVFRCHDTQHFLESLLSSLSATNAGLLSTGPSGVNFSEILIKIQTFSFTKMHLEISFVKWWPSCPRRDELMTFTYDYTIRLPCWVLCIQCLYLWYRKYKTYVSKS